MIFDLKITFVDEKGNKITYKMGTHYLKQRHEEFDYVELNKSPEETEESIKQFRSLAEGILNEK